MKIFIDSHVHVYPCYDLARMFAAFEARTKSYGADLGVIMLAQRKSLEMSIVPTASTLIVAGRQIACAERVEILALGAEDGIPDGIPARDAIRRVLDAGALPVLAWGVGKWLFKREKVVESLFSTFTPSELAVGDSSMRPIFWPEPRLMRQARAAGYRLLHGSDPLPPKFEETRAGQFGDLADTPDFDPAQPVAPQIVRILRESGLTTVGRRAGICEFVKRIM